MSTKPKILLIVESPKKAKVVYDLLDKDPDADYIAIATKGHITELSKTGSYKIGVDLENQYKPNYVICPEKVDVFKLISNQLTVSTECIICTDGDREGEVIAHHLYERIKTHKIPFYRAVFDKITIDGVRKGLANKRSIDENMAYAGMARRVLDRIVGYMASPFVINNIDKKASAGRVQSVALKMIVNREQEIEAFKQEEYWTIKANFKKGITPFSALLKTKTKIDKATAENIVNDLQNNEFVVKSIKTKSNPKKPPPPLTTVKFQSAISKKYNVSPTEAMEAAQALYEEGKISYMRTDSVRTSPEALEAVRTWIANTFKSVPAKPHVYDSKDSAQDAHECIQPIDINRKPKANPKNNIDKAYDVIWRYFVSSQMNIAQFENTTVTMMCGKYEFNVYGKVLKNNNSWMIVLNDNSNTEQLLPEFVENEKLQATNITKEKKLTQPPPRYDMASLVEDLEKNGIGRPATYAPIVDKISVQRGFVALDKDNKIFPTPFGRRIVECLDKSFSFMDIKYTAQIEKELDLVAKGKVKYHEVLDKFYKPFSKELKKAKVDNLKDRTDYKCKTCDSYLVLKKGMNSDYLECGAHPICDYRDTVCIKDGVIIFCNNDNIPSKTSCFYCGNKTTLKIYMKNIYCKCTKCRKNTYAVYDQNCPHCNSELFIRSQAEKNIEESTYLLCSNNPICEYRVPISYSNVCKFFDDML